MVKYIFLILFLFTSQFASAQTYIQNQNLVEVPNVTATAAGTTTLAYGAATNQVFTGTTTQTAVLPSALSLQVGRRFYVSNESTGTVTLNYNGGTTAATLLSGQNATLRLLNNGTSAGTWDVALSSSGSGLASIAAYSVLANNSSLSAVPSAQQSLTLGTPAITDTGVAIQTTGSVAGYFQHILQNTSNNSAASSDFIVNNNLGTASTYFGDFGINSSTFTGSGSLNLPSATYLYSTSGDLVLGSATSNSIHLLTNSATTDAMTINSSGGIITPALTGYIYANGSSAVTASTTIPVSALSGQVSVANGGSGVASPTAHGVLLAEGASAFTSSVGAAGTIHQGAGASADPTWTASPVLGAVGTTGTIGLSGTTSGVVTVQPQAAAGTYNFNLPTTAGSSGNLLASGGGGSAAMTWVSALANPMTTANDIILGGTSGAATRSVLIAPLHRGLTGSSGTFYIDYAFLIASSSVTAGATYSNNSVTFTVDQTIASQTILYANGSGAPSASGTLTLVSGTGPGTIAFTAYRVPIALELTVIGSGGGGGAGGVTSVGGTGALSTTFGSSLISCGGGGGGGGGSIATGGAGGTCSIGSLAGLAYPGNSGNSGGNSGPSALYMTGGIGGAGFGGGAGYGGGATEAGGSAGSNSGGGGGGGGTGDGAVNEWSGGGGGAGGMAVGFITNTNSAWTTSGWAWVIAGGGAGGSNTYNGGNGGTGVIKTIQHYQ